MAFTGISGSGKSSLAFGTIYAAGSATTISSVVRTLCSRVGTYPPTVDGG